MRRQGCGPKQGQLKGRVCRSCRSSLGPGLGRQRPGAVAQCSGPGACCKPCAPAPRLRARGQELPPLSVRDALRARGASGERVKVQVGVWKGDGFSPAFSLGNYVAQPHLALLCAVGSDGTTIWEKLDQVDTAGVRASLFPKVL